MMDQQLEPSSNTIANRDGLHVGRWQVGAKIGAGHHGEIRVGKDSGTGELVAIKLASIESSSKTQQLHQEKSSYERLGNAEGIPKTLYFGFDDKHKYTALVLELLGPSLGYMFDLCGRRFSIKTVIQIALQILHRLECLHSKGLVHRSIKPENFLLGRTTSEEGEKLSQVIYMVDLGRTREYLEQGARVPYCEHKYRFASTHYMSINAHLSLEQSRRDDLESLGYMLMYFLRGELPWIDVKVFACSDWLEQVKFLKIRIPIYLLCDGYPEEFAAYLSYVRNLDFFETPDYKYLQELFTNLFHRKEYADDGRFDWSNLSDLHNDDAS